MHTNIHINKKRFENSSKSDYDAPRLIYYVYIHMYIYLYTIATRQLALLNTHTYMHLHTYAPQ